MASKLPPALRRAMFAQGLGIAFESVYLLSRGHSETRPESRLLEDIQDNAVEQLPLLLATQRFAPGSLQERFCLARLSCGI